MRGCARSSRRSYKRAWLLTSGNWAIGGWSASIAIVDAGTETATGEYSACRVKAQLMHRYDAALSEYSRTVSFLYQRIGTLSKSDYYQIADFTEVARLRSERARLELEQHTSEHGC